MVPRRRKSDGHEEWTKEDIVKLLIAINSQLIEGDTCVYSRRIQLLNWNEIRIDGKSVNGCKLQLEHVIRKIHRTRTLAEILSDVDIEGFNAKKQKTSDDEEIKSNLDFNGCNKEVSIKLQKLPQIQNESKRCQNGSCSENEDIKTTSTKVEIKDDPREPMTPFNFFTINLPAQVDITAAAKTYQNLRKEERVVYIEMSKKAKIQYKFDLASYVISLTPSEQTEYLKRLQLETEAKKDEITNLKTSNDVDGNSEKSSSSDQYNGTTSDSSVMSFKLKRKAEETTELVNKKLRKEIDETSSLIDEKECDTSIVLLTNLRDENEIIKEMQMETEEAAQEEKIPHEKGMVSKEDVIIITPVAITSSEQEDSKTIKNEIDANDLNDTLSKREEKKISIAGKRPYFNYLKNIYSGFLTRFGWGNIEPCKD